MNMRLVGAIAAIETIAEGNSIRELAFHWYEAHGIGKVKLKIKRWLS